jgi:hypothetical protein
VGPWTSRCITISPYTYTEISFVGIHVNVDGVAIYHSANADCTIDSCSFYDCSSDLSRWWFGMVAFKRSGGTLGNCCFVNCPGAGAGAYFVSGRPCDVTGLQLHARDAASWNANIRSSVTLRVCNSTAMREARGMVLVTAALNCDESFSCYALSNCQSALWNAGGNLAVRDTAFIRLNELTRARWSTACNTAHSLRILLLASLCKRRCRGRQAVNL